jgi:hypothetical protein
MKKNAFSSNEIFHILNKLNKQISLKISVETMSVYGKHNQLKNVISHSHEKKSHRKLIGKEVFTEKMPQSFEENL